MTTIKIGQTIFPISVTVLEDSSMDFLLGLDMLRRHQCSIDLHENVLKIGTEKVPFLGEGDLPMHLRDVNNQQPGDELRSSSGNVPPQGAPAASLASGAPAQAQRPQFPEEVIKSLEDMGFARPQVLEALVVCGGDAAAASNYLLSQ
jgi:DNA damage-inducible protein 1